MVRPKLVELARQVDEGMVCELQNAPWVLPTVQQEVGVSDISPYSQDPRNQMAFPYDTQMVGAWLSRWDPRLVLQTHFDTQMHLPGSTTAKFGPDAHALDVC